MEMPQRCPVIPEADKLSVELRHLANIPFLPPPSNSPLDSRVQRCGVKFCLSSQPIRLSCKETQLLPLSAWSAVPRGRLDVVLAGGKGKEQK